MVSDWRASWAKAGASPTLPFVYVGLSAWPMDDAGIIPVFRHAAEQTTRDLARVGMVVAADIADPAGAYHPIHPPWKAEVARRAWLWADAVIYGNASSPASSPHAVAAVFDAWDASWGDFHHGTGANSYVCEGTAWFCAGIRVTFDTPVRLRGFYAPTADPATRRAYDFARGAESGFRVFASNNATAWWQPVALGGISPDGRTVTMNLTWIAPGARAAPTVLRYGWSDYPLAAPLEDAFGLPVGPFNISIVAA